MPKHGIGLNHSLNGINMITQSIKLHPEPEVTVTYHNTNNNNWTYSPPTDEERQTKINGTLKRIEDYKINVGDIIELKNGNPVEVVEIVTDISKVIWYDSQACCLACRQVNYQGANIIKYSLPELTLPIKRFTPKEQVTVTEASNDE